jgi:hypothetical protein
MQPSSCGNGAVGPRPLSLSQPMSKDSLRYLGQSIGKLWSEEEKGSPRGTHLGHMKNFYTLPIVRDSSCRLLNLSPQEAEAS